MARAAVPAISRFADTVGYSRAVRDGRHVYVAGTAPVGLDSDDPYEQAKRCLELIVDALSGLGAGAEPASAMLVIAGMLDPAWKVEIEADALLPE